MTFVAALAAGVSGWAGMQLQRWEQAERVDLQNLEAGASPPSVHLELGPHYALYGASTAPCSTSSRSGVDTDEDDPQTYYPVLSLDHPLTERVKLALDSRERLDCIPGDSALDWSGTRVFIVSDTGAEAALPQLARVESYSGYLRPAGNWEGDLPTLREHFPGVDWATALVLKRGPGVQILPVAMFGIAAVSLVVGLGAVGWLLRPTAVKVASRSTATQPGDGR